MARIVYLKREREREREREMEKERESRRDRERKERWYGMKNRVNAKLPGDRRMRTAHFQK